MGELPPSLLTAPQRKELLMLAGDVESNPGPYTEYGKNSCDINLGSIEYKEQFMVNGIMHNVTIHSLTSKCCQLITTFPSCSRSVYIVCTYHLE